MGIESSLFKSGHLSRWSIIFILAIPHCQLLLPIILGELTISSIGLADSLDICVIGRLLTNKITDSFYCSTNKRNKI